MQSLPVVLGLPFLKTCNCSVMLASNGLHNAFVPSLSKRPVDLTGDEWYALLTPLIYWHGCKGRPIYSATNFSVLFLVESFTVNSDRKCIFMGFNGIENKSLGLGPLRLTLTILPKICRKRIP